MANSGVPFICILDITGGIKVREPPRYSEKALEVGSLKPEIRPIS